MNKKVCDIIKRLELEPHPEGGFYRQTYRSKNSVVSTRGKYNGEERRCGTSIYYLLESGDFSAFHRLSSDETWYYHKGSPLFINIIKPDGELDTVVLGDDDDLNWSLQVTVPAGCWFSASVMEENSFCLVGCSVSPGFEFKDFELGDRGDLMNQFPQHRDLIKTLTRAHKKQPA